MVDFSFSKIFFSNGAIFANGINKFFDVAKPQVIFDKWYKIALPEIRYSGQNGSEKGWPQVFRTASQKKIFRKKKEMGYSSVFVLV